MGPLGEMGVKVSYTILHDVVCHSCGVMCLVQAPATNALPPNLIINGNCSLTGSNWKGWGVGTTRRIRREGKIILFNTQQGTHCLDTRKSSGLGNS